MRKPENKFQRVIKKDEEMAASSGVGVSAASIIPNNVKYIKLINM